MAIERVKPAMACLEAQYLFWRQSKHLNEADDE
jgi:hypothetical protein